MVQCANVAQIGRNPSQNQRVYGLMMVRRVVKSGLDGDGRKARTEVDRLLGVRKSMVDQWCLFDSDWQ